ncbi:uncharacterized protein IL334_006371 [Kwoniella shivajii]|uniref:PCI domain-containing protein n=1 Tax=Kwoniella shivajii TaxID=564305 RepID=A0ABZ1D9Q6_9TREE|nr:hypothetical protein IL334_006371 [Kwoniella shivajii]
MSQASSSRHRTVEEMLSPLNAHDFDWKAYEGTYQGRALITRLFHIPSLLLSSQSKPTFQAISFSRAALARLIPHLKNETWDWSLYYSSIKLLKDPSARRKSKDEREDDISRMDIDDLNTIPVDAGGTGNGSGGEEEDGIADIKWIENVKELERRENNRLDVELRGYLSNLIKESIRLTYLAFAQLSVKVGNSQAAMKNYSAVREYSTSSQHHVDLGVGIVETLLAFNLPSTLPGHISKLESTLDRLHPPPPTTRGPTTEAANVTASDLRERRENEARSLAVRRSVMVRIRVAKGLVALHNREWSKAGRELGSVGEEEGGLGDFEGKAISSADLALITAFCILASADRDRIRRVLLDRTSFKAQIDDHDSWIVDLISAYVDANYGQVMNLLQRAEPMLLLNPFLSSHAGILLDLIEKRCILQYVKPFATIQIPVMATAFGLDTKHMLSLVEGLVENKEIQGKVDLIDQILVLKEPDHRGEMFTNAFKVGKKAGDVTQTAILRMKMIEAGILVDPRNKSSDRNGHDEKGQLILDEGLSEEMTIEPPSYEA